MRAAVLFLLCAWGCGAVTILVYDNGSSEGGVPLSLSEWPQEGLAALASRHVTVRKHGHSNVVADRVFREDGVEALEWSHVVEGLRYYCVAPGLEFVWPFVAPGHVQSVSPLVLPPSEGSPSPVVLESVSDSPRVFRVLNLFSEQDAQAIIDNALSLTDKNRLKRSTVGSSAGDDNAAAHKLDTRTSENAWDSVSPAAKRVITRSFQLTRMEEHEDKVDGLQVVRYKPGQGYYYHPDYFGAQDDRDFNFNPWDGGSNRFATVFLYLNNVSQGGQTVFPRGVRRTPPEEPPQSTLDMWADEPSRWEYTMTKDCYAKLAVPPQMGTAALFYSVTPDGRIDPNSEHGACPTGPDSVKFGANVWLWNRVRYGLPPEGAAETGEARSLLVINETPHVVQLSWQGQKAGTLAPGASTELGTFVLHKFKAHLNSILEPHFEEYAVTEDSTEWVLREPEEEEEEEEEEDDSAEQDEHDGNKDDL